MPEKLKFYDNNGNKKILGTNAAKKVLAGGEPDAISFFANSISERLKKLAEPKVQEEVVFDLKFPQGFTPYNNVWRYEPVESKYFFIKMLGESLTPVQQEACDVICSPDPFKFTDLNYKEADLFWGKRGGKDATTAKIFTYQLYRLCCIVNPQNFLGMGVGSAIDIANVSKSGKQAKAVFFKYLTTYVRNCKDVKCGLNWFSKNNFWFDPATRVFKYQNLREGDSIQKDSIDFSRGIVCHSLNSDRFTGEGLNLVLVVIDEIGSMRIQDVLGGASGRSTDIGLYDSLKTTVSATTKHGKVVCVSYKYGRNCPMSILVKRNEKLNSTLPSGSKVFISKHSTFEVRPDFDRKQISQEYAKNPIKAQMMYEIKDVDEDMDTLYDLPYVLDGAQDVIGKYTKNPFKDKAVIIDDATSMFENLEEWFRGREDRQYVAHIDLAKGQVWRGGDAVGLAIGHLEDMRVSTDARIKKYLKEKLGIEDYGDEGELRSGVVIDLACQIICRPEDKEVRVSDIRKFLINLKLYRGFDFYKIFYDSWSSLESIQEFNKYGIDAEQYSVDKNPACYHTEKDLVMLGLFKIYPNRVWVREKKELTDINGKIDHPDISNYRLDEEGVAEGSKDLSDCTAAVTIKLLEDAQNNTSMVF